ncbi:MAG: hypothetical protein IJI96_03590 [Methanobrevibacter sp.]|nr:hypothetical protein [Methanobrevibacter sp.]
MNSFEKKCAEENKVVEIYFNEGMLFEAWITIIRESEIKDGQDLFDELDKIIYRKSSNLTEEEMEELNNEFFEYRNC